MLQLHVSHAFHHALTSKKPSPNTPFSKTPPKNPSKNNKTPVRNHLEPGLIFFTNLLRFKLRKKVQLGQVVEDNKREESQQANERHLVHPLLDLLIHIPPHDCLNQ